MAVINQPNLKICFLNDVNITNCNSGSMGDRTEKSPGKMAMEIMETIHKEVVFKKPLTIPRRRNKKKILDEETYVEVSLSIICTLRHYENDFVFLGNRQDYPKRLFS